MEGHQRVIKGSSKGLQRVIKVLCRERGERARRGRRDLALHCRRPTCPVAVYSAAAVACGVLFTDPLCCVVSLHVVSLRPHFDSHAPQKLMPPMISKPGLKPYRMPVSPGRSVVDHIVARSLAVGELRWRARRAGSTQDTCGLQPRQHVGDRVCATLACRPVTYTLWPPKLGLSLRR